MIRNIKTPHLPEGEVRHIIIGEKYRNLLENAIINNKLEPIWMPDNPYIDSRLAGHADLSVNKFSGNTVILSKYLQNSELFKQLYILSYDCVVSENAEKPDYPYDAGLNVCQLGTNLIYNSKTICQLLNNKLENIITDRIDCRQGYTKCAVCIADENSIITADRVIADKAKAAGMDVLLINNGIVKLDGFDYGFIGGATFKLNKFKMAFTGTIDSSSEKNVIEKFLSERGIEAVYLTQNKLFDIGSAILITESI